MILETLFAETLRDYLKTTAAQTAGLPAPTALSYLAAHERGEKARPLCSVHVERQSQTHPEMAVLTCTFKFETNVSETGKTLASATDTATAEGWILALRQHLSDLDTFTAFFDALSLENRTGWKFLKHYLQPHYKAETDAGEHTRDYEQVLELTLRIDEGM